MIRRLLTVTAALAAALSFAPAANATIPSALEVGGVASGSHAVTLASTGSFDVSSSLLSFGCSSATGYGAVYAGSPVPGPWMDITTTSFSGCVLALGPGVPLDIVQTCNLTVDLRSTATATNAVTDTAVDSTLTIPAGCLYIEDTVTGGFLCNFDVAGTVDAAYDEVSQVLDLLGGGTLEVQNMSGCFGLAANNDPATITASLAVTSPDGDLNFKA